MLRHSDVSVRALTRSTQHGTLPQAPNLTWVRGDLDDPASLKDLLVDGARVVHLAFPADWPMARHIEAARALAACTLRAGAERLVHCSTAVVVGDVAVDRVDEDTPCRPVSQYERAKFEIESVLSQALKGAVPVAILRPTAVVGPGGQNLVKVARELTAGRRSVGYLRACLYGTRRMNLVCVDNVAEALTLLLFRESPGAHDTYLVSDDDDPGNNYRDVRRALMKHFGISGDSLPVLPAPSAILSAVQRLAGRSATNPMRYYDAARLTRAGYRKATTLSEGLEGFARWYTGAFSRFR